MPRAGATACTTGKGASLATHVSGHKKTIKGEKGKGKATKGEQLRKDKPACNMTKTRCYNCLQLGHPAKECKNPTFQGSVPVQAAAHRTSQAPTGRIYSMFTAMRTGLAVAESPAHTTFYVDSGASDHFTPSADDLFSYKPFAEPRNI